MKSLFLYAIGVRHLRHIFTFLILNFFTKPAALFPLILFFASNLSAQPKASFQWSEFQKVPKYSHATYIFKTGEGYGVILKYGIKFHPKLSQFQINFYDKDLKITKRKGLTINKNKERVLDIWYYNGRIFFLTHTELGNQRVSARLRIIQADNSDLTMYTEDIIILNENRFSRNFTYNSRRNLTFNLSRKDSSLSIWHTNPPETMDAKQSVTSHMYNNEMKLIDKAIIDLPEVAKLCEVLRVDDLDGDEFLICTKEYAINPIDKRGFSPNYKFVFYVANPSKEQLSSFTYKDENVYLERPKLKWNKGVLEATGLFADKLEGPKIGIWFLRYNFNTKTLMSDTLQYFDKNVRSLPGNGFQASLLRNSKFESFYIDYFIKVSPNKRMVVAEQFFLLPASFGSSYTYNRFYGDILILYMDEKGVINNAHRLIKAQQTFNNFGEFSSYYLERKDTMLKFIYNDNSRNKDTYRFKHLVWHKHSNINVSEVTAGSTYNYSISNYKLAGGIIQVRDMEKIGPDTYLIYANKKKKGKLGIMKLQP